MFCPRPVLAAALALAACGGAAPSRAPTSVGNPAADARAIDALYATFTKAYETFDPDLVANLYTENALYLSPGSDVRRGRAAIRAGFRRSFERTKAKGETMSIWFDRFDRRVSGDVAYEVGYFVVTYQAESGDVRRAKGKFTVVLIRQRNGSWLFHVDSYSDVPES